VDPVGADEQVGLEPLAAVRRDARPPTLRLDLEDPDAEPDRAGREGVVEVSRAQ